jgi:hypothetical protein
MSTAYGLGMLSMQIIVIVLICLIAFYVINK